MNSSCIYFGRCEKSKYICVNDLSSGIIKSIFPFKVSLSRVSQIDLNWLSESLRLLHDGSPNHILPNLLKDLIERNTEALEIG